MFWDLLFKKIIHTYLKYNFFPQLNLLLNRANFLKMEDVMMIEQLHLVKIQLNTTMLCIETTGMDLGPCPQHTLSLT